MSAPQLNPPQRAAIQLPQPISLQHLASTRPGGPRWRLVVAALAWLGLWAVRQQPSSYAELAHLDPGMLLTTFVLALLASLIAGLLPAWSAMQVSPAMQLKSQ